MSVKIERINSNLVKEIGYLLAIEVKDPLLKQVTVTDVKTTNDLSFSKVYITIFDETKKDETLKSLKNASKFLRTKLAERIDIRHIPELIFVYDESINDGNKIEKIINDLNKEN